MSMIPPDLNRQQSFYLSGPLPCPYLPNRVERKLFTHLTGDPALDSGINSALTRAGFRRSHDVVYRPACDSCQACVPVRLPVTAFAPSRILRRITNRNRDLTLSVTPTVELTDRAEIYALFIAYQNARHADSDMAQMSGDEFDRMLQEGQAGTQLYQLRDAGGRLVAALIVDPVGDGASAVYSFFDPARPRRSLGVEMILRLIAATRERHLSYVYLGYWIAEARKMSYKARFQPLQALGPQGWQWLEPVSENQSEKA